MMDLTFLIPTKIETEDRLRNIISSVSYLLKNIPAKVIVKEVSNHPTFQFRAVPEIRKYVDVSNLEYFYEESQEPLFCKSKVLNDLIVISSTKVVANYDADCILPIDSYHQAYDAINEDRVDIVYPYGCGIYQWKAAYNSEIYEKFVSTLDTSVLDQNKSLSNSTIGWTQFINRQKYIESYMMNENFISWGCEDDEFYYRMNVLGNRIGRIDNYVYHLEHSRTHNSWFSNPNFNENYQLWNQIKTFDKNQLVRYYESQDYVKSRRSQIR
jgi:hypothetical protein